MVYYMELGIWFIFHDGKLTEIVVKAPNLSFDYDRMEKAPGGTLTYIRPAEERQ